MSYTPQAKPIESQNSAQYQSPRNRVSRREPHAHEENKSMRFAFHVRTFWAFSDRRNIKRASVACLKAPVNYVKMPSKQRRLRTIIPTGPIEKRSKLALTSNILRAITDGNLPTSPQTSTSQRRGFFSIDRLFDAVFMCVSKRLIH